MEAESRAVRVASQMSMDGYAPPSPPKHALVGMEGALAAYASEETTAMESNGMLHGSVASGGFDVPHAQFRRSGFLTDAGGGSLTEYRRLVLGVAKRVRAATRAESRRSGVSCSASRVGSDLESVQSGLSATHSRIESAHSLRGADGGSADVSSGIVAEALRQAAAVKAEQGMAALLLGAAGDGYAPEPVQVPERVRAMAEAMDSAGMPRQAASQRREPAPLLSKEERAESRQAYLSRSISRAESNVESLQSELLGRQAAAARRTSDDLEVVAELQLEQAPIAAPAQAVAAATAAAQQAAALSTSQQAWSAQQAAAHATAPRAGSATALQAAAAAAAQQAAAPAAASRAGSARSVALSTTHSESRRAQRAHAQEPADAAAAERLQLAEIAALEAADERSRQQRPAYDRQRWLGRPSGRQQRPKQRPSGRGLQRRRG